MLTNHMVHCWGHTTSNFSCPKDQTTVLISTVYAVLNAAGIRFLSGKEINQGLSLKDCNIKYNGPGLNRMIVDLAGALVSTMKFEPAWKVHSRIAFRFFGHENINLRVPCLYSMCYGFGKRLIKTVGLLIIAVPIWHHSWRLESQILVQLGCQRGHCWRSAWSHFWRINCQQVWKTKGTVNCSRSISAGIHSDGHQQNNQQLWTASDRQNSLWNQVIALRAKIEEISLTK